MKAFFDEAGAEIIAAIRLKLESTGANATGKTSRSLEAETTDSSLTIFASGSIFFAEVGRRGRDSNPANRPPPVAPLIAWVEARGLATGKAARGMAFALQRKIAERGTVTVHPERGPQRDIYSSIITEARINSFLSRINRFAVVRLQSEIIASLRDASQYTIAA